MSKNIFITGTGTDVGKTFVTALILKKLRECGESAAYYKAAMSGNERRDDGTLIPGDALYVKTISGIAQPLDVRKRSFSASCLKNRGKSGSNRPCA